MRIGSCRLTVLSLLLCFSAGAARAELPDTLLEPVYHALLSDNAPAAWQQLIARWPRLNSETQRAAWKASLSALISRQCGNDIPVVVPAWLDSPILALVQRDIPLNRIYLVQLSGKSSRRDLRVSLLMPDGEPLLTEAPANYEADDEFRLESKELGEPLPPGVYQLSISSGGATWRQPLALPGSSALNWISRESGVVKLRLPEHENVCPIPWVEQMLLHRPDFNMVWWQRAKKPDQLLWPHRSDAGSLWTDISVIRAEARGGLTVRVIHRLGGPLQDKGN